MQPINYMANLQPVDILGSLQSGLKFGQDIKAQQEQQAQAEQYKVDFQDFIANPTPQKAIEMEIKHPGQGKAIKDVYDRLDEPRKQSETQLLGQVYIPLQNGDTDTAISVLEGKKQAMANSGQDTTQMDAMINMVKTNPQAAKAWAGMGLVKTMGTEQFQKLANTYIKAEEAPIKRQEIMQSIESKRIDDQSKKLNDKLRVIKTSLNKETAGVKKEELTLRKQEVENKLADLETKKTQINQQRQAESAGAYGTIDNMLNTTDRLLKNKSLGNVVGSIEGRLPSIVSDEGADAIALIDTLSSQAFLSQVSSMKGMGALSDAEGKKLSAGLQSFDRVQSEDQFRKNLKEVQRLMLKARKNIEMKYGTKQTVPDTPAAMPSDAEINDLLKKYGQ